ncbi:DUF1905 domain-containing protein [Planktomarina temperata]|nr:DUF1905 domain-containing protein [Planktomarina temperata]
MAYFTHEFVGKIDRHGVGKTRVITYKVLFMPTRFEAELPFKTYPRLRVEGEIADVPVRGAWMPVGDGGRYFIVSPQIKANTGLDVGDQVEMRFRVDDQDYVDVPATLNTALKSEALLAEAQQERRTAVDPLYDEVAEWLSSTKKVETCMREIMQQVAFVDEATSAAAMTPHLQLTFP